MAIGQVVNAAERVVAEFSARFPGVDLNQLTQIYDTTCREQPSMSQQAMDRFAASLRGFFSSLPSSAQRFWGNQYIGYLGNGESCPDGSPRQLARVYEGLETLLLQRAGQETGRMRVIIGQAVDRAKIVGAALPQHRVGEETLVLLGRIADMLRSEVRLVRMRAIAALIQIEIDQERKIQLPSGLGEILAGRASPVMRTPQEETVGSVYDEMSGVVEYFYDLNRGLLGSLRLLPNTARDAILSLAGRLGAENITLRSAVELAVQEYIKINTSSSVLYNYHLSYSAFMRKVGNVPLESQAFFGTRIPGPLVNFVHIFRNKVQLGSILYDAEGSPWIVKDITPEGMIEVFGSNEMYRPQEFSFAPPNFTAMGSPQGSPAAQSSSPMSVPPANAAASASAQVGPMCIDDRTEASSSADITGFADISYGLLQIVSPDGMPWARGVMFGDPSAVWAGGLEFAGMGAWSAMPATIPAAVVLH